MKICTMLASGRKNSVFFSYDWFPVVKNEDVYSVNFTPAYIEDHGEINTKHRLLSKKVNFFQMETNLVKTVVCLSIPCRCGVSVQFSRLDPVQQQSYRFLATPVRTLLKICLDQYPAIFYMVTLSTN